MLIKIEDFILLRMHLKGFPEQHSYGYVELSYYDLDNRCCIDRAVSTMAPRSGYSGTVTTRLC